MDVQETHMVPIGVIGGMGPYAGLRLVEQILDQTVAHHDQEHLPVALLSYPQIGDRSQFVFGETQENPAYVIAEVALALEKLGVQVAGMPCNTAHAPVIFDTVRAQLATAGSRLRILHIVEETVRYLSTVHAGKQHIGILATRGTCRLGLYQEALRAFGLGALLPDEDIQDTLVNRCIYDPDFGVKAQSNPVTGQARQSLLGAIRHLQEQGADAVILGCTELPLAVPEPEVDGLPLIDPSLILARALVRETYPEKLRAASQ